MLWLLLLADEHLFFEIVVNPRLKAPRRALGSMLSLLGALLLRTLVKRLGQKQVASGSTDQFVFLKLRGIKLLSKD